MKDSHRIAIGLVLLFVVLAAMPSLDVLAFLRPLRHVSPWILFAFFWLFFWRWGGCCGRSGCRRPDRQEDDNPEETI